MFPVSNESSDITSIDKFGQNTNDEIFKLLNWLNRDFMPSAMFEIMHLNNPQVKEVLQNWRCVEAKLKEFKRLIMRCVQQPNRRMPEDRFYNYWKEFSKSGEFDEAMARYVSFKESSLNESNLEPVTVSESDLESLSFSSDDINQYDEEDASEEASTVESHIKATNTSLVNKPEVVENGEPEACSSNFNTGKECCVRSKNYASFKFNFKVWYSKNIETVLFAPTKHHNLMNFDQLGVPTIQYSSSSTFKCLLCCCEGNLTRSLNCVLEHVHGHKHMVSRKRPDAVQNLVAYHQAWINQEHQYQAHQAYFFPYAPDLIICNLCYKGVPFNLIEYHITSELHKKESSKIILREKTVLTKLQELAYLTPEELQNKEASTSSTGSHGKRHVKNSTPAKRPKKHKIVWSIADFNAKTVKQLLEYRFWSHLQLLMAINKEVIQCSCCDVVFVNHPKTVIAHIHSPLHLNNVKHALCKDFYCEICACTIQNDLDWFVHLDSVNHTRRCVNLPKDRRVSLREYHCITCHTVIFGDTLSLRRHQELSRRLAKPEVTLSVNVVQLFKSNDYLENYAKQLVDEANMMLLNSAPMLHCVGELERALRTSYPTCKVYPFGSRVSGLGNENSDLDVFVDMGDMYLGDSNQDRHSQERYVYGACKVFRKIRNEFSRVNPIPTARTPIVQVLHVPTNIDCDLSFKHGLSVENTKFLKLCIKLQPVAQSVILILKKWLNHCELNEYITTYAVAMMVIFYLQIQNLLLPITKLKNLSSASILFVNGWSIMDFTDVAEEIQSYVKPYSGSLQSFLIEFFNYYKSFNYDSDIICPLLGYPLEKQLFVKPEETLPEELSEYVEKCLNPDAERLQSQKPLCIQDPFDLCHNLTKACTLEGVEKLKAYCDLSGNYLNRDS